MINVFGLALSMSVCLLVISIITNQYSSDQHNPLKDNIYRVNTHYTSQSGSGDFASAPLALGEELKEGLSSITEVVTIYRKFGGDADVSSKIVPVKGFMASASLLRIMDFPLLYGDQNSALKEPYSVVLTEATALKLFNAKDVIGQTISFGEKGAYTVTGVLEKTDNKSHIAGFEILASASTIPLLEQKALLNQVSANWSNFYISYVYFVLNDGVSSSEIAPYLNKLADEKYAYDENLTVNFTVQPLTRISPAPIELSNQLHFAMPELIVYFLSGLAMMIMLSACFNYTNLSIARALTRAKEIGIRKVSGAFRTQIFMQFITESIVISLLSLIAAFGILQLLIPAFHALDPHIPEFLGINNGLSTYLTFLVFSLFIGVIAGLFPALYMSKLNPASILKDFSKIKLFARLNLRKALIVVQFTLSLLFIISATILHSQFKYSLNFDLGFAQENILNVDLQGNDFHLVKNIFESQPEVTEVGASLYTLGIGRINNEWMRNPDRPDSLLVVFSTITPNYLSILDHELIAGTTFPENSSDSTEQYIIVNEYMIKNLGYGSAIESIGEIVHLAGNRDLKIIGVVKDFNYTKLNSPIHEFAFRYDPSQFRVANMSIESNDIQATILDLETKWSKIDPVHEFSYNFYDDQLAEAYGMFFLMTKVIGFFAFLAISISSLGLLGMAVYSTESRLKEIGIRKALGANERNLVYLLSRGFMGLLVLSVLIAVPIAWFGNNIWLAEQAFKAPISLFDLLFGSVVLVIIGLLTIGTQTLKAAKSNPVETLRIE
jgi:ABC-type antimicrobial peptide transport system permease subunit